ncbi:MAG: type II CAAX endopeptidase family protein, partial [Pseudomonadota bacterium]
TFKEGQHMMAPVMLAGLLPAISGIIPDTELTPGMAMLPGFNVTLLLKQLMIESVNPELIFITLMSNSLFAVLALIFAASVFSREPVIFGGGNLFDNIFKMRRDSFPRPEMGLGLLVFTILLVASFYISSGLAEFGLHIQIPVLQLGVFLSIPLLVAYYFRWDFGEVFRLNTPSISAVFGAIVIGLSAWLAVSWTAQIIPVPPEFAEELIKMLGLDTPQYSIVAQLVLLALLPAICEEFAFRGMLLSAFLKHFSPPVAIFCTALCFGLAHMSLYRFIPTLVLGLILGYAVWQTRSIWVGVIIHALNNGILVLSARYEEWLSESLVNVDEVASLWVIVLATVICGTGFWFLTQRQQHPRIAMNK